MNGGSPLELGLTSALDELFMDDQGRAENRLPKIYEIPLTEIDDFPDHPFYVRNDEDMDQLVASVKERGIITPVMLRRKEDGRYEMVSGHRRKKACELAGLETIKAEIRDLTRDEAIMLMVESNLQRSKILPSEKAFAYKMRLDAMNRQGQRTDLTSNPVGGKSSGIESASVVGVAGGDSGTQVRRYIRLTNLVPELLHMVDDGRIALRPAVELSYLHPTEQLSLVDTISYEESTPSLAQAIKMREFSKAGKLNPDVILSIMCETKGNQREKISISTERIRKYIPKDLTPQKTEEYILAALEHYQKYRERQNRDDRSL
jgi:ParB family chromosome partitioning protein